MNLGTEVKAVLQGDNDYLRRAREEAMLEQLIGVGDELPMAKWGARDRLVAEYSWAIPNDAALEALAAQAPLIEIGAGGGYWAYLLRQRGVDVVAYDPRRSFHARKIWTAVDERDHEVITAHQDRAVFFCWPTMERWAAHTLDLYTGDTVVYIGEWGGCTADEQFHARLREGFEQIEQVEIPCYYGVHDYLSVWQRTP